jgi:hypothetical protein
LARPRPFGQELGVVSYRERDVQRRVLVLERIVGVGVSRNDLTEFVLGEGLPVLLGQHLEQPPLAGQPLGVAVAVLLGSQYAEVDIQSVEHFGQCLAG